MSDQYVENDGFRPLLLPESGEDFRPGRQYLLTPLARLILAEVYGLAGLPTVVECVHAKRPAQRVATHFLNLESGEAHWRVEEYPAVAATLRAYVGGSRKWATFTVDIAKLVELAPFYDKSHRLPFMEDEWFATRNLPSTTQKFRGCSLRWWSKQADGTGQAARMSAGGPRRFKAPDLSALD